MNRKRRRKRKSVFSDILSLISSMALVVIAAFLVVFVYTYIKNNSFMDRIPFIGFRNEKASEIVIEDSDNPQEAANKEDLEGFVTLCDGSLIYLLSESELKHFDEECVTTINDRKAASNSWIENGNDLYYFGEDGLAVREHSERAFNYTFNHDYVLEKISYNSGYSEYSDDNVEFPAVVKTKTLWAFIDDSKAVGNIYPIKIKKTTDSLSHELGGKSNLQYTSQYAMSIDDGYVYYAVLTAGGDNKIIAPVANKLFRMKPGAETREIAADYLEGYKLIHTGEHSVKVYYYDGEKICVNSSFVQDDSLRIFPENASYYVSISGNKPILMMDGDIPVTLESSSFTAGNFIYSISAEGEVLSVASKSKVSIGGYSYMIENGQAFGQNKARVIRQDNAGTVEVISSEFMGRVGNMHYDFASSRIIAEYTDVDGKAGLISINTDGDVDIVSESMDYKGSSCVLYSIHGGKAVIKTGDSETPFAEVSLKSTYPLAVSVDPIVLERDDDGSDDTVLEPNVKAGEAPDAAEESVSHKAPDEAESETSKKEPEAQKSTETAKTPEAQKGPQVEVGGAPSAENGSSAAPSGMAYDTTVEKKGPGSN